jgi:uncharacterized protein (DUF3084 family)
VDLVATTVLSSLIGTAVTLILTFGFYKAILQRAIKDIVDLRTSLHGLRNFVVEYQNKVDNTYARKELMEKELGHIREGQERIENAQRDIAKDVSMTNQNMTQLIIQVTKLGMPGA